MAMRRGLGAVLVGLILLVGACGDDGSDGASGAPNADQSDTEPSGDAGSTAEPSATPSGGSASFDGEEMTIERVRCFFEEQPRAGLGGVFTHTAQADAVNPAGEAVVIDMSRAVAEDGTVTDDISFDVGDPFGDDFVGYSGGGPEGTLDFGDDGVSAADVEMRNLDDFEASPSVLSFDLSC
ncbi:MAG TPA: hypothetical protein VMW08_12930 [Acidimicrobiales bacterium]|nr:hypothetical protein [Acidimicrobiales bacterium]